MKVLVQMMLDATAESVSVVSASPMVKFGDRYGIAMSTDQLVARDKTDGGILTCEDVVECMGWLRLVGSFKL
jgi:glutamine phosphoribosylpyrophosphate amidotransferase